MTGVNTYHRLTVVAAILFIASACTAQYDLYCLGSSYTIDHQVIQSMADTAGIPLKAGRSKVSGSMSDVRQRAAGRPLDRGNPLRDLGTGTTNVLAMTATRPWRYTEVEAKACAHFARQVLQHNPDARIFIHDYWTVLPPDRSLYPTLHGWDNVRGMNLGAVKIIHLMAKALNHKMYIIPVGAAIQTMREHIIAGDLEGYKHPDDLMSDSIHLSEMGRYIQACLTFCGACQYDVRRLPGNITGARGKRAPTFSPHDAKIIHEVVYDTVRNTRYSGWNRHEPSRLADYLAHLKAGLKNWESFDKMPTSSDTGMFKGDNGIDWTYAHITSGRDGEILTDTFIKMRNGSSLSATIPNGIADLHFAMYRGAKIEVTVNSRSLGAFKPVREGGWDNHYFKIGDLNLTGDVKIEFTCRSKEAIMDNISWTNPH
ncbi:MAG: hypothetical protein HQ515_14760 [Phycisphaeraceae bacterium]|nr:hypothetical protein [Phycisphaeraceae bacterium]